MSSGTATTTRALVALLVCVLGAAATPARESGEGDARVELARRLVLAQREARDADAGAAAPDAARVRALRALPPGSAAQRALEATRRHWERRGGAQSAPHIGRALDLALERTATEDVKRPGRRELVAGVATRAIASRVPGAGINCCLCSGAASCDDGVFCNGLETCANNICSAGQPAVCDDGDACTDDFCDFAMDTCDSSPTPAPAQVAQLEVARSAGSTRADVNWTAVVGAVTYNLYRGEMADLADLTCHQPGIAATAASDDGALSPSGVHVFLVTAEACGESSLGSSSSGDRGAPAFICP